MNKILLHDMGESQTPSDRKEPEERVRSVIPLVYLQKQISGCLVLGAGQQSHLGDDGIGLRHDCNDGLQDCISLLTLSKCAVKIGEFYAV